MLLKTGIATAQKEVFDVLSMLEADKDGVILRGSVEDLDWLARQISIFSFDFVVREPDELRAELKKAFTEAGKSGKSTVVTIAWNFGFHAFDLRQKRGKDFTC